MRVLIAEDEPRLAEALARGLRRAGCAVDVSHDGRSALDRAHLVDYDAVVLDRDLPVVHGDDVCRELRGRETPPRILMLTAATTVADRIDGLQLGADDYLCKPFAFAELVARLQALQRRGDRVDARAARARRHRARPGASHRLTRGRAARSHAEGVRRARGAAARRRRGAQQRGAAAPRLGRAGRPVHEHVRVTVMNLRRKLGEPAPLTTVIGAGYRIP